MRLIENKGQWHKLWSVRLAILSAVLGAIEMSLPAWSSVFPPNTFAFLSTITAACAAAARVIKQESVDDDV